MKKQCSFATCLLATCVGLATSSLSAQEAKLTLRGHKEGWICVAFSPDGKRIVSGSADKTEKVWDAATGKEILSISDEDCVTSVAFSPDGKRIASAYFRTSAYFLTIRVKVWDAATGKRVLSLKD